MVELSKLILFCVTLPSAKSAAIGTYFWKPRLGLDLAVPTTEKTIKVHQPNQNNIQHGLVVLIDGYAVGMTVIALAVSLSIDTDAFPHLSPRSAYFYTNVYRWSLRYLSLIPDWLGGNSGNYVETHRTWKKRFHYMDKFVPQWMQKLLFYIKKEEWAKERTEWKNFKQYAEPAFGKHYRTPNKIFNNFKSQETKETVENLGESTVEF